VQLLGSLPRSPFGLLIGSMATTQFSAIRRIWSTASPPLAARLAGSSEAQDQPIFGFYKPVEARPVQLAPRPRFFPVSQAPPAGAPRAAAISVGSISHGKPLLRTK
jgi:hypothetical protein